LTGRNFFRCAELYYINNINYLKIDSHLANPVSGKGQPAIFRLSTLFYWLYNSLKMGYLEKIEGVFCKPFKLEPEEETDGKNTFPPNAQNSFFS